MLQDFAATPVTHEQAIRKSTLLKKTFVVIGFCAVSVIGFLCAAAVYEWAAYGHFLGM